MNPPNSPTPNRDEAASGNPGSAAEADALLNLLDLQPGMTVLDVGCGHGDYTLRLLDIYPSVAVTGIDADAAALAQAHERANRANMADRLTLAEPSQITASAQFDAAVCIGASSVFGSYAAALRGLAVQVKPGGLVLIAGGYWQREPGQVVPTDFYPNHAANVAAAEAAGLVPLYAIVDADEAWSDHEAHYTQAVKRHFAAHPGDADLPATRDRVHNLCRMYLRLGRALLGHGWYLFQRV